jgi:uncharacterized protein (UPF0276 family)
MIELSVTYFPELLTLSQQAEVDFQYVRLGNWVELGTAREVIAPFPDKKFLYHHNANLRVSDSKPQALITTLQAWQQLTDCPWLSAHLDHHTDREIHAVLVEGKRPPRYDAEQAFDLICQAAQSVQAQLPVPLLLENVEHWPLPEIDVTVMPEFIGRVVEQTGCDLLLDTAHARVTAARLGCDVRSYLGELPLNRAVEMHVSSPRFENGQWVDCHETLVQEDYALLEWLLHRTAPRVITLEYCKDPGQVQEQISHLNQLITQVTGT